MKKSAIILLLALTTFFVLASPDSAIAAFNKNNVISDNVFERYSTMRTGDIQTFFNQFPNSCLKNYEAAYPNGYDSYGDKVSAAKVIKRAAKIYGINPQVIIATLQKESSLVTGNDGCASWRYKSAMGMACPDGGECPAPGYGGFSRQVTKGAWLLKFGKERANGNVNWEADDGVGGDYNVSYGGPMTEGCHQRNIDSPVVCYDGLTTIDSESVYITSGATGSFYNYTPHLHGNQLFVSIFEDWFGPTVEVNYNADFVDRGKHPLEEWNDQAVLPGERFTNTIRAKNTGNIAWYDQNGISDAPYNTEKVLLMTDRPRGRSSDFAYGWHHCDCRASSYFSRVYRSDGETLSGNQSVVLPGQFVEWDIEFKAPNKPGLYREWLSPYLFKHAGEMETKKRFIDIEVIDPEYKSVMIEREGHPRITGSSLGPVAPGEVFTNTLRVKNIGSAPWYDQGTIGSARYNTEKVLLITLKPLGRNSDFALDWYHCDCRASSYFSRVYESDGETLSDDQGIVEPGQFVEWDIEFKAPSQPGYYREWIAPYLFKHAGEMEANYRYFDIEVVSL